MIITVYYTEVTDLLVLSHVMFHVLLALISLISLLPLSGPACLFVFLMSLFLSIDT